MGKILKILGWYKYIYTHTKMAVTLSLRNTGVSGIILSPLKLGFRWQLLWFSNVKRISEEQAFFRNGAWSQPNIMTFSHTALSAHYQQLQLNCSSYKKSPGLACLLVAIVTVKITSHLKWHNLLVKCWPAEHHCLKSRSIRLLTDLAHLEEKTLKAIYEILTVQRDYGNRSDRKLARLKYTVDKYGADW